MLKKLFKYYFKTNYYLNKANKVANIFFYFF